MFKANPNSTQTRRYLLLWIATLVIALIAIAFFERLSLVRELTAQSATLHRLASQRADQHDAHLTSLSAIFVAGGADRQDLLFDVSATIKRFYPRIISVNLIAFDPTAPNIQTFPTLTDKDAALVRQLAQRSTGALEIQQMSTRLEQYLVVKRSPNTEEARHGLALVIDANALIATDDPFWQRPSVYRRLLTPDGDVLTGGPTQDEVRFSKMLGSGSQPLTLETGVMISLADV